MPQVLPPSRNMLKTAEQINCQVPRCCVEKCKYKYCQHNTHNDVQEPQHLELEKLDKYWSEFLKAQLHSNANYLYKIKTFGKAQDPTLVKKEPVPTPEINYRLLHMPYAAGLLKEDLFYLLSFLLNLVRLPVEKQKEYMEYFLNIKLLDIDIINYLDMISRHPNAGLTESQLQDFQKILQHIMDIDISTDYNCYFNPEHIFMKSFNDINPYEIEYLKKIMKTKGKLSVQQSIYLAKFVYKLQGLNESAREEYLKFLRDNQMTSFKKFEYLVVFLFSKAKRMNQNKLRTLFRELQVLMDIGPCEPAPEPLKKPIHKDIVVNHARIDQALRHLMTSVIPNIVLFTALKDFLQDMLTLNDEQVISAFNSLKISNALNAQRFNFIEKFINAGKLGKLDKNKKKKFLELIRQVATAPTSKEILLGIEVPAFKGPIRDKLDVIEAPPKKATEEVEKPSTDLTKQKEEETSEKTKNSTKLKKPKSSSKKASKKPKKKAGKKKK